MINSVLAVLGLRRNLAGDRLARHLVRKTLEVEQKAWGEDEKEDP